MSAATPAQSLDEQRIQGAWRLSTQLPEKKNLDESKAKVFPLL